MPRKAPRKRQEGFCDPAWPNVQLLPCGLSLAVFRGSVCEPVPSRLVWRTIERTFGWTILSSYVHGNMSVAFLQAEQTFPIDRMLASR